MLSTSQYFPLFSSKNDQPALLKTYFILHTVVFDISYFAVLLANRLLVQDAMVIHS